MDAEQDSVETLERLASAFTEKYLASAAPTEQPSTEEPESVVLEKIGEDHSFEARERAASTSLHIQQNVSPNFGIRLRRFVGQ